MHQPQAGAHTEHCCAVGSLHPCSAWTHNSSPNACSQFREDPKSTLIAQVITGEVEIDAVPIPRRRSGSEWARSYGKRILDKFSVCEAHPAGVVPFYSGVCCPPFYRRER